MQTKWIILILIILVYLPVSIDASILHIATPTLSLELKASSTELLWIIDIYSLVMAGLLLPMGALGDRLGFKKLCLLGLTIFGLASLFAALSPNTISLILARVLLAVGAAMILPATLSGLRNSFPNEKERNFALGLWAAVGVGGAAVGPLIGGYLLEYFYWGSVFLVNIPIVLITLIAIQLVVPKQQQNPHQQWKINEALILIVAILLLVYALKSALRIGASWQITLLTGITGTIILVFFIRQQWRSATPMIDFQLLTQRVMIMGVIMAMTAMISLVGFELLMAQELQLVHQMTPLNAGIFMLPLMLASSVSGPIAGILSAKLGLRKIAALGMGLSACSFLGLALCDFMTQPYLAKGWMILLGFSSGSALLASTAAIMASAPKEKAASAGALESMAYELGAGFGVVILGSMLAAVFSSNMLVPDELSTTLAMQARGSISEAFIVADSLSNDTVRQALISAAKSAFSQAHSIVLISASFLLLGLTALVWWLLPKNL